MQDHHHYIFNFLVAGIVSTIPLWMMLFEDVSWFAYKAVPIVGLIVALLQLYFLIKKLRRH